MADVRKELERYFDEIDTDKSGFIDAKELEALMVKCGYKLSKEEIKGFLEYMDESRDGKVSKEEYVKCMEEHLNPEKHEEAMLRRTFNYFDKDGSGTIDGSELGKVFKELGEKVTEDQVKGMMMYLDQDKSGTVDFKEFKAAFAASKKK